MRPRTTWEKLAAPTLGPDPDEESRVVLDAVFPGRHSRGLRAEWPASAVRLDPFATTDWSFAADAFLRSDRARPGARIASDDPHATELGALGIAAFHHAPAALHARALSGAEPLGLVRRVLVHVNDAVPDGLDAMDVALHLLAEAGPALFGAAALEFAGDAVDGLGIAARRRLLGAAGITGCLTATGPFDVTAREAWTHVASHKRPADLSPLRSDAGAVHDELVVVNANELRARVLLPVHGQVVLADKLRDHPVAAVVLGGCVGGDLESMRGYVAAIERGPAPKVPIHLVPASHAILDAARADGLEERVKRVGATLAAPCDLALPTGSVLATSPCLVPPALLASPTTILASARAGFVRAPEPA